MNKSLSPAAQKAFNDLVNAVMNARAVKYFYRSSVRLNVKPASVAFPYERSISASMNGPAGGLLLLIHFDLEAAVLIASASFGNDREEVSDDDASDYLLEFTNLVAGFLRGALETVQIEIMRLIPYLQLGSVPAAGDHVAELEIDEQVIAFSYRIDAHKQEIFEQAVLALEAITRAEIAAAQSAGSGGEIEFL